ncbi:iron ABC transporter permease [Roseovarius sp. M141]|uniref:FecCD family ABC transporter permease n=1 Tax=Roseovarius sp. M141 TaxID=2583806 RepID=UPI0020CCF849|nr:iron ABC transporter permease [Roseovarius sp. M141]MCQ0091958.1 iron ABC transporter permease [Roseovarius sp. M141]
MSPTRRITLAALPVLAILLMASLAIGSRPVPLAEVIRAFTAYDGFNDLHLVVRELRLPRTLLAVAAGASLGLAGALMQAVTRNPLAEPGLLGVNSGAALAVVIGAMAFNLTGITQYIWFGILGAGLAGVAVFVLGRAHESGTDPVRLVLAGAGLSVALGAASGLLILNSGLGVLDIFRNWGAGALEGRGMEVSLIMLVVLLVGGGLAAMLAPALDALALGQDLGRVLGLSPRRIWALACFAVMVLAGGATAAAGPIAFIGLVAPHAARAFVGPGSVRALPLAGLIGALLLLLSDILARVVVAPSEVAAGIVAALLGGPFFIHVVRRFRLARV